MYFGYHECSILIVYAVLGNNNLTSYILCKCKYITLIIIIIMCFLILHRIFILYNISGTWRISLCKVLASCTSFTPVTVGIFVVFSSLVREMFYNIELEKDWHLYGKKIGD